MKVEKSDIYFTITNKDSVVMKDVFYNITYSNIIDTIIRERYSASQVEAIVNN